MYFINCYFDDSFALPEGNQYSLNRVWRGSSPLKRGPHWASALFFLKHAFVGESFYRCGWNARQPNKHWGLWCKLWFTNNTWRIRSYWVASNVSTVSMCRVIVQCWNI